MCCVEHLNVDLCMTIGLSRTDNVPLLLHLFSWPKLLNQNSSFGDHNLARVNDHGWQGRIVRLFIFLDAYVDTITLSSIRLKADSSS